MLCALCALVSGRWTQRVVADIAWLVEVRGIAALHVSAFTGLMNTGTLALVMLLQSSFNNSSFPRNAQL